MMNPALRNTVLVLRSSNRNHVQALLEELRRTAHPDDRTRWIWVVQRDSEREMKSVWENADVRVVLYDRPRFGYAALHDWWSTFPEKNIDVVYVPWNNPDGRGYFQIHAFLAASRIPKILVHTAQRGIEPMTLGLFLRRRVTTALVWFLETIVLIVTIPFVAFYYLSRALWFRFRDRVCRCQMSGS